MNGPHDVHVCPAADGRWDVEQGGQVLSRHRRQATARAAGQKRARVDHVELVVHGRDGRIHEKDSFGRESGRADTER